MHPQSLAPANDVVEETAGPERPKAGPEQAILHARQCADDRALRLAVAALLREVTASHGYSSEQCGRRTGMSGRAFRKVRAGDKCLPAHKALRLPSPIGADFFERLASILRAA